MGAETLPLRCPHPRPTRGARGRARRRPRLAHRARSLGRVIRQRLGLGIWRRRQRQRHGPARAGLAHCRGTGRDAGQRERGRPRARELQHRAGPLARLGGHRHAEPARRERAHEPRTAHGHAAVDPDRRGLGGPDAVQP
jgi:hypothetical protein